MLIFFYSGISGPRGRPGKAGKDGNHGIPGVNLWKIKVNGTFSNEMLIPPSIASMTVVNNNVCS